MFSNLNDDSICRLCLESGACNSIFTTLVSHRSSTMSCSQMIEYFVSSTIQEGDGLPCHICSECIIKLKTSYSFKKQCERSYNFLINHYKNEKRLDIKREDLNLVNDDINEVESIRKLEIKQIKDECCAIKLELNLETLEKEQKFLKFHENFNQCISEKKVNDSSNSINDKVESSGKLEIKQIKDLLDDSNKCRAIKLELNVDKVKTSKEDEKLLKLHENFDQCIFNEKVKDNYVFVNTLEQSEMLNEGCKNDRIIFAVSSLYKNNDSKSGSSNYSKDENLKKRNQKKLKQKHVSRSVRQEGIKVDRTKEILGMDINMLRTAEKHYQCNLCPRKFKYKRIIIRHLEKHLGIKSFFCKICQEYFSREWEHMQTHYPRVKKFQCDKCHKKFMNKSTLNIHILSHIEDKPIKCSDCGKSFKSTDRLAAHKKLHSEKKEFICQFCSRGFVIEKYLITHIKYKHTNERLHQCTLCEKRFVTRQNLKIHEKRHLGIKDFHCDICNKSFVSKPGLTNHSKMHSGEKPYECRICSVKFKRSDHRNRHELTAHGVKAGSDL